MTNNSLVWSLTGACLPLKTLNVLQIYTGYFPDTTLTLPMSDAC